MNQYRPRQRAQRARVGVTETERNGLPPIRELPYGMPTQQRLLEADLDYDSLPQSVRALVERDKVMRHLVATVGPYSLRTQADAWVALASAVIYQQVTGKAAASSVAKLRKVSGGAFPMPATVLGMTSTGLASVGLTRRKAETLRELASAVESSELDLGGLWSMEDGQVLETLCRWKGVGPWTAHMFLVFHLGREDVIMPGDLGIRKAIARNYGFAREPTPDDVLQLSSRWAPARTIASWYLWKSIPGFPEPGFA